MLCRNCGKEMKNTDLFCKECGTPVYIQPEVVENAINEDTEIKKEPKKPKKKKGKIIALSLLVLFLGLIAFLAIYMFPLKVKDDIEEKKLTITKSEYKNLSFNIESNQPVLSATYSYVSDENGEMIVKDATLSSGLLEKEVTLDKIPVHPGKNTVTLNIETLFGHVEKELIITRDIGFTTAPDKESLIPINDSCSLVSNELVLVFNDSASEKEINSLIKNYDGTVVGRIYDIGEYHVRFSGYGVSYINELKTQFDDQPIVDKVYYNYSQAIDNFYYPNDSGFDSWNTSSPAGNNWWLELVNAPGAWDHASELKNIKVGVMDSVLEYTHEDIQVNASKISVLPTDSFQNMKQILDYYKENVGTHVCTNDPNERCIFCSMKDHGTHCSGIIAAKGDNKKGISGVAWNADLYFTTSWYLDKEPDSQMSNRDSIDAWLYNIDYLVSNGCRVLSWSVGCHKPEIEDYETAMAERINDAFERLEKKGYDFLLFKAAGNDYDDAGNDLLTRVLTAGECSRKHVVVVGAVKNTLSETNRLADSTGDFEKIYNLAGFSNYGDLVDIAAPGVDVYSTVYGNSYRYMQGTSMATPLAAGVACLVYGANPSLTYSNVKSILDVTCSNFCTDEHHNMYRIVNAEKAVEWALNNGKDDEIPPVETPKIGFVTGMVQDAKELSPIYNAEVVITSIETGEEIIAGTEMGKYNAFLAPGHYNLEFSAENYKTETIYNVEVTEGNVSYNVLLNMVDDDPGVGAASGRIVNAFDAASIPNAMIKFYEGINNDSGSPVLTVWSDDRGYYYAENLAPGNYTIYTKAEGFSDSSASVLIIAGETRQNQDCSMTPILKNGEIRVVLTWGEYPSDLDSHLNGPTPRGDRFHVYYRDMNYSLGGQHYVKLDVDDRNSYGPETTSVYIGVEGTYTFSVHDYSNRSSSHSTALSLSGAQVKLYIAGRSDAIIYNVPNIEGTLWTVFSIENGVVTPINSMSYQSDEAYIGS